MGALNLRFETFATCRHTEVHFITSRRTTSILLRYTYSYVCRNYSY
jgi:hypothetical protein